MTSNQHPNVGPSGNDALIGRANPLLAYAGGAIALIAALALRWLLDPWLGESQPLATVYGAIALAVWLGGWRTALLIAVVGYLASNWLFMEPRQAFGLSERQGYGVIAFLFSSGIIIGFGEAARHAMRRTKADHARTLAVERQVRESEATLRAFYDSSPIPMGVTELTADGDILHVYDNAATCRFFGIAPGSTTNRRALAELGAQPSVVEQWIGHYKASEASGGPVHFEHEYPGPSGPRWLSATVAPIGPGPSGRMRFCYVAEDVTDRRRATEEREATEQRLRETREVLQAFMDNTPARTWIKDEEGRYVFRNRASEQVIGMSSEEYVGRTDFDLFPGAHAEQMRANDRLVLASGEPHRFVETVTINGEERQLLAVKFPIVQEGRRLVAGVSLDITDQMRAESQLREADRRKDEFLATLAHELRNPLAPIRSAVQWMRAQNRMEPHADWAQGVIERQVGHMARLLEDLLDVSRISRNKLELRKVPVPLASVIQSAVETSRPLIESAGHALTLELPDEPVRLQADPVRLSQVFANLLNNAAKYTPDGGRIAVQAVRVGEEVAVSVKDNGIGIAPEMASHLFEMFSQGDPTIERSHGGLGIGLALARELVRMHGGTLEAHSDGPGRGSSFVVRLPIETSNDGNFTVASGHRPAEGAKCRVLVVDDLKDAADSLAALLKAMGHEVQVAYDGENGIAAAGHYRPDAVLLDLGMPKLSGFDVCRHIRAQAWGKSITLIALTGWGQETDRRRTELAGFDHHLVKPVESDALMEVLMSAERNRVA